MNDRLLFGTSWESAVMKAGKFRFWKKKEKRSGNYRVERQLFGVGDSSFADLSDQKEGVHHDNTFSVMAKPEERKQR